MFSEVSRRFLFLLFSVLIDLFSGLLAKFKVKPVIEL